ncbi:unnamed protein product [Orchesella dallaii]|uniref:DUF4780 domain-containing protein n=1 Tax=Orchesella dallaii TaxID=48710 RepID=A0ABP1RRI0_9HEXA
MEGKEIVAMEEEGLLEVGSPGIVVDEMAELRLLEEEEATKLMPPPPPLTASEIGSVAHNVGDTKGFDDNEVESVEKEEEYGEGGGGGGSGGGGEKEEKMEEEGVGKVPEVAPTAANSSSGGSGGLGEGKKKKKKKKKKKVGAWATYAAGRLGLQMVPCSTNSPTPAGEGVKAQATPGSSGLSGGAPAAQGTPSGSKRKMEDRSPQANISPVNRKKSLLEETYANRVVAVITKVMISHKDMTCGTLSESHRSEIRKAMDVAMEGSEIISRLRMERITLEDGRVAVHCSNEDTVRWVKDSIPTVLDGRFLAWEMKDLPPELRYEEWFAFLDAEELSEKTLLTRLGNQNEGLMVNQWKLLGIRRGPISKSDPGGKKVYWITFAIPVGLAALLETVAYRPYYLSGRLGEMRKGGQRPRGGEPRR